MRWILIGTLTLCRIMTHGQHESDQFERLIEAQEEQGEDERLIAHWNDLKLNPLDLNKCNVHDLISLQILTLREAQSLIDHRNKHGPFLDLLELQCCDLDPAKIQDLLLFVSIKQSWNPQLDHSDIKHQIYLTFQTHSPKKMGFVSTDSNGKLYIGNRIKHILRYRSRISKKIRFGITAEKDEGEPFFKYPNRHGFDFNSGYVEMRSFGWFNTLILGDYQLGFGQGLTLGSGLSFGKSSLVLQTKKNGKKLTPYRSLNENNFLRGIAGNMTLGKTDLTIFVSRNALDANKTIHNNTIAFTSLQTSGNHRRVNEWEDKNVLRADQTGYHIRRSFNRFSLGQTTSIVRFNGLISPSNQAHKTVEFSGKQFYKIGLDHHFYWQNALFFGELSYASNYTISYVEGFMVSLSKSIDATLFYRSLSPGFIHYQSQVFSESSSARNEKGLYSGIRIKPVKIFEIVGYADFYRFPWFRHNGQSAGLGKDLLIETRYTPTKKLSMYFRIKWESKGQHEDIDLPQRKLIDHMSKRYRFNIDLKPDKHLRFRTRVEYNTYQIGTGKKTFGSILFQDMTHKLDHIPIKYTLRLAISNIDHFNNRIYTYENDVPLSYSIPFYQHDMMRVYVLISYRMNRNVDFWWRFAYDYKSTSDGFGSGLDHIAGNHRSNVKFQIKIQL